MRPGGDYAAAGVSIEAGERAVTLMKAAVARAGRPEVVGGIGGVAGLFDASALARYRRPLLATSTDGVGTKVVIAQRLGRYDTVGIDLVAMVVDDLAACGAEPLFLTDYVVFGKLIPERAAEVVRGVAHGCEQAGCALLGGLTTKQRASGLLTAVCHTADDLGGALGNQLAEHHVVGQEQRFRTAGDQVVHDHRDQVDAHRAVTAQPLGDDHLGAHPVGGGGEQRAPVGGQPGGVEQPGEAADPTEHLRPGRAGDRLPHQRHGAIPRLDAHPSGLVPRASTAHGRAPAAPTPSSTCLPRSDSATGTG